MLQAPAGWESRIPKYLYKHENALMYYGQIEEDEKSEKSRDHNISFCK